jgi:DNA-binding transcriptional regulator YiaG
MDWATVAKVRQAFRSGRAKKMRERAGLSLRELAAMADVPSSSLQTWEAGQHSPRADACIAWAAAMKRLGLKI